MRRLLHWQCYLGQQPTITMRREPTNSNNITINLLHLNKIIVAKIPNLLFAPVLYYKCTSGDDDDDDDD